MIESLVQECLPKSIGHNGMIQFVPPSVIESLVQVCLPKGLGQNGMIH